VIHLPERKFLTSQKKEILLLIFLSKNNSAPEDELIEELRNPVNACTTPEPILETEYGLKDKNDDEIYAKG
jgi:hypothetical protein